MRHLLSAVFAVVALSGAYIWTFGLPAQVAGLVPFLVAQDEADAVRGANTTSRAKGPSRATTVIVEPLRREPYTATIQAVGTARSWRRAEIAAETSGRVSEVFLKANREVGEGEVLVQLDNRTEQLNLKVARAEQVHQQSVVDRYRNLRAKGNSTVTDVTLTEAELALTQAENAVGLAEVALDRRTIRAPFRGTLGLSDIEVGDLLEVSSEIVSLENTEILLLRFELPERAVSVLSLERTILASTPSYAGRVFEAEIVAFDSRLDETSRSISVEARIDNTDGLLWSGMTFAVRVLSDSTPLAMTPTTALSWTRHGAGIWVVEEGRAVRHPVTVRFRRGGDVWLDTDLDEGAMVVIEGAAKLRPGSPVEGLPGNLSRDLPLQAVGQGAGAVPPVPDADPAEERI